MRSSKNYITANSVKRSGRELEMYNKLLLSFGYEQIH